MLYHGVLGGILVVGECTVRGETLAHVCLVSILYYNLTG